MTTINPLAAALAALFDQSLQAAVTSSRELDENEVRDLVGRVMDPTVDRLDGRINAHAEMTTLTLQGLHERIATLEARVASVVEQLANRLWSADQATLEQRLTALAALEARLAALEAAPAGLQRFADGRPITAESIREIANAAAEAALDEHCESYDHDDYDAHVNDEDKHPEGDLEKQVRDVIDGLEITLSL
jgi:BMFP domain-containing protein YqiC